MLKFEHVSKRYSGGGDALLDVSFHLPPGAMVFLTGHSGAGKSTVLKLAAAAIATGVRKDEIRLDGRWSSDLTESQIPYIRRKMGLIFQDYKLLPIAPCLTMSLCRWWLQGTVTKTLPSVYGQLWIKLVCRAKSKNIRRRYLAASSNVWALHGRWSISQR